MTAHFGSNGPICEEGEMKYGFTIGQRVRVKSELGYVIAFILFRVGICFDKPFPSRKKRYAWVPPGLITKVD